MEARGKRSRIQAFLLLTAVVTLGAAAVTACGGSSSPAKPQSSGQPSSHSSTTDGQPSGGKTSDAPATQAAADPALIVINPASNTTAADPASPLQVSVAHGKLTAVTAQISGGGAVAGALDAAATSWTSSAPLGTNHTFGVTVTAIGDDGKTQTATSNFSTLKPASTFIGTYFPDAGDTVGVGQPVSIRFNKPIADKAAVEKQLTVEANPPVTGSWYWYDSQRVDYRPEHYWASGTKVTLHMRLDGVKSGTSYGTQTRDATFTVGRSVVANADMNTKRMSVTVDGKTTVLKISGGKPGFATWNGTMVVLEKFQDIPMDSKTVNIFGPEAYDLAHVYWAVRLTPSGTFTHAAPWNDGKFGLVNGSHGCIGMSTSDAEWFYNQVNVGDPVTVVNSQEKTVKTDNGYGDWNISWADWTAGSAVKH